MLSPGFSIPSIGTPLHQMEADQQIVAPNTNVYHPPVANTTLTNAGESNLFQSDSLNQIMGGDPAGTLPIPHKQMNNTFGQDTFQAGTSSSNERGDGMTLKSTLGTSNTSLTITISGGSNNNSGSSLTNAPQTLMQPQTPVR